MEWYIKNQFSGNGPRCGKIGIQVNDFLPHQNTTERTPTRHREAHTGTHANILTNISHSHFLFVPAYTRQLRCLSCNALEMVELLVTEDVQLQLALPISGLAMIEIALPE